MVRVEARLSGASISEFTANKQIKLFAVLKQKQFSGQVKLKALNGAEWIFYLSWGRLVYATGGDHSVRRWVRQVSRYCPELILENSLLAVELSECPQHESRFCWEYRLLSRWHKQEKITQKQAAQVIFSIIVEVLFDVTQVAKICYESDPDVSLSEPLVLINAEHVIRKTEKLWQAWQDAKLADRSPNLAPVIKSPAELKKRVPARIEQTLSKLLDGQSTFRDLGNRTRRNVLKVTQSLLPYIQAGLVELVQISDVDSPAPCSPVAQRPTTKTPLIACVDDSWVVCKAMEKILSKAGYQVMTIQDDLKALAILLAHQPDLIFLDLVMPNTTGYEICGYLRRLPVFRETPIVILTGNDGVVDRIRAKMVGASAFLRKPAEIDVMLALIEKQLSQQIAPSG